jgi:hypothetical protein
MAEGLSVPALLHIADRLVHQRNSQSSAAVRELEPGLLEALGLADRWPVWLAELNSLDSAEKPS